MSDLREHDADQKGGRDDGDEEKRGFEALEKNGSRPSRTDGRPSARPDQHDTVTEFCCHFLVASPLGRVLLAVSS
jgi:hypothetical protein